MASGRRVTIGAVVVLVVLGALAAGLVALAPDTGGDGPSRPETASDPVALDQWLAVTCPALDGARTAPAQVLGGLAVDVDIETAAGREELRDALVAGLDEAEAAVEEADAEVAAAGVPEVEGGADLVAQVRAGVAEVQERLVTARQAAARTPVDPPDAFRAGLIGAAGRLEEDLPRVVEVTESLGRHPEVGPALGDEEACAPLG